jgi:cytochrome c2
MRRVSLLVLALAVTGCADKPAPRPTDDPPPVATPKPDPDAPAADGSIPPPRPLLREHTPEHAFEGRKVFLKMQCISCHTADGGKGPNLEGLYGTTVELKGGGTTLVDDGYLFESIRKPRAKVAAGWEPIMPAYDAEQLPAEELSAVIAYIRSLGKGAKDGHAPPAPGSPPK